LFPDIETALDNGCPYIRIVGASDPDISLVTDTSNWDLGQAKYSGLSGVYIYVPQNVLLILEPPLPIRLIKSTPNFTKTLVFHGSHNGGRASSLQFNTATTPGAGSIFEVPRTGFPAPPGPPNTLAFIDINIQHGPTPGGSGVAPPPIVATAGGDNTGQVIFQNARCRISSGNLNGAAAVTPLVGPLPTSTSPVVFNQCTFVGVNNGGFGLISGNQIVVGDPAGQRPILMTDCQMVGNFSLESGPGEAAIDVLGSVSRLDGLMYEIFTPAGVPLGALIRFGGHVAGVHPGSVDVINPIQHPLTLEVVGSVVSDIDVDTLLLPAAGMDINNVVLTGFILPFSPTSGNHNITNLRCARLSVVTNNNRFENVQVIGTGGVPDFFLTGGTDNQFNNVQTGTGGIRLSGSSRNHMSNCLFGAIDIIGGSIENSFVGCESPVVTVTGADNNTFSDCSIETMTLSTSADNNLVNNCRITTSLNIGITIGFPVVATPSANNKISNSTISGLVMGSGLDVAANPGTVGNSLTNCEVRTVTTFSGGGVPTGSDSTSLVIGNTLDGCNVVSGVLVWGRGHKITGCQIAGNLQFGNSAPAINVGAEFCIADSCQIGNSSGTGSLSFLKSAIVVARAIVDQITVTNCIVTPDPTAPVALNIVNSSANSPGRNIIINNSKFRGGLVIDQFQNISISNCEFFTNTGALLAAADRTIGGAAFVGTDFISFTGCTFFRATQALQIQNVTEITFDGCDFRGGIVIPTGGQRVDDLGINNCTFGTDGTNSITALDSTTSGTRFRLSNSHLSAGMFLDGTWTELMIQGNKFDTAVDISAGSISSITVTGNRFGLPTAGPVLVTCAWPIGVLRSICANNWARGAPTASPGTGFPNAVGASSLNINNLTSS
jgi:hypothetical protein